MGTNASARPTGPVEQLVLELARLPGIGPRSASRLAHFIIHKSPRGAPHSMARELSVALRRVAEEVRLCERCRNLSTEPLCVLCADPRRQAQLLCVVESVSDLEAIERLGSFAGLYFVLHGSLSPMEGRGPDSIGLPALLGRVAQDAVSEVILALDATLEGDTTALFLASSIAAAKVRVTRLASGVPHGGELEYLDRATLGRAFLERRAFAAEG
jgi:recombination protein RecR